MSQQFSWEILKIEPETRFMDVMFESSSTRIPMRMPLPLDGGRILEGEELSHFILVRAPFDRLQLTSEHCRLASERLASLIGRPQRFTEADYAAHMGSQLRGGSPNAPRVLGKTQQGLSVRNGTLATPVIKVE